ncbi:zinc-dependent metalloprotease [Tomitella fengzijianii]|uniref:Zinc-dependent metalloprotease n=1 Tax=Tomitella fengzijianii TaxID=2597660 RepID=A0A516X049_9ACTN|nr:zinc-dependent metalloprotease [Tomitella fengzijianii]QDQ96484.1 zinc-dependent metalloprotease [Tomitella fengzijianii]
MPGLNPEGHDVSDHDVSDHDDADAVGRVDAGDIRQGFPGDDVDWALAARIAARLAPPGPTMTGYTRDQVYAELSRASAAAEPHVRRVTGLADGLPVPPARVVDRAGWARAATASMGVLTGPATGDAGPDDPGSAGSGLGLAGKAGGVQAGAVFAFLSTAILGQYDPFTDDGTLLLVAPNVVAVERALKVRPADFRMWVCLHEVTHRVQFSSSPWLTGYMRESIDLLSTEADEPLTDVLGRVAEQLRKRRRGEESPEDTGMIGLVSAAASEPQRQAIDRMLMLGTLLEGHADHVMDSVGPEVVPTVARIRAAFDHRREHNPSVIQRVMRSLLGVDAKMAQYVRGKAFVDAVVERVGMEQFNTVWTGPETLPLKDEIEEPQRWIARVLG